MKAVTLLLAAAAFGAQANHDEHESHSHGAHEHGHGHLNLVFDGNQLMIELQALPPIWWASGACRQHR